mgnify:CR=1 FL=1
MSLQQELKNGIVLCQLINSIKPGACGKPSTAKMPFKQARSRAPGPLGAVLQRTGGGDTATQGTATQGGSAVARPPSGISRTPARCRTNTCGWAT